MRSSHLNFQLWKHTTAIAHQLLSGCATLRGGAPASHTKGVLPINGEVNQLSFEAWLSTDTLDERCYLNTSCHDDENDYGYFSHISNAK